MEQKSLNCLRWGILFSILNIHVGRWNLLPDFVGMLLLGASVRSHREQTDAEEKLQPLFLILAVDSFAHWIWDFENGLESLICMVIYLYAFFVLLGEVILRIRDAQPEEAKRLETVRMCTIVFQALAFLAAPYGHKALNLGIVLVWLGFCAVLLWTVWRIRSCETPGK